MASDPQPPKTLLILGASGDLTGRLLLPGVGGLLESGQRRELTIVGAGMDDWDANRWRARITESFATVDATGDQASAAIAGSRYVQADVTKADDLRSLLADCATPVAIFFALPPPVTAKACRALTTVDLPEHTRLVLEKPFGVDEASAHELNLVLAKLVPENQIHRVDHFLGKSTVLNLLGIRFANRFLEPVLNAEHVASVDIVFDESLALEGRAGYYDGAGALVDMIQSHLLQILAVLTMEPPPTLAAADFRERKAQVLRATKVFGDDPVTSSRRARYTAGRLGKRDVPAYVDEKGITPSNMTETLAEVTLTVDTWRWAGVPFRLRSGKAMGTARKEAIVTFRYPPRVPSGLLGVDRPNRLVIGFGPDRMALGINVNGPGNPYTIDHVELTADFGPGQLPAYGEVLLGVLDADPSLSVRGDTAEDCWRIVDPVLAAWRADAVPLQEYPAGSQGPDGWPV